MAMPTPTIPPVFELAPRLRVDKALAGEALRGHGSLLRKIGWAVLWGVLGVALILAIIAQGRRETDPEQAWFWTPEWLQGELEAEQEIAAGQGIRQESDETFEQALRDRMKPE